MMALSSKQEKKLLLGLLAVFAILVAYRILNAEKPRAVPLVYPPGTTAASPLRRGVTSPSGGTDPLILLLARREEKFPGVARDIFRMANPAPKPKPAPAPVGPPPPTVPVKTPEEIAADTARADLSKFRLHGYLNEKDSNLFLSKDGETFIVKSGDTILKNYRVKETGKDYVILLDTITRVEVRVELSGSVDQGLPKGR
jgi:hypothetical protein